MNPHLPADYRAILDSVKQSDSDQSEVFRSSILSRNDWLCDFVAYWPNVRVEVNPEPPAFTGSTQEEMWDWLWANATVPCGAHSSSGLTRTGFDKLLDMARSSRLVYPDGDVNVWARKFINAKAMLALSRKPGKKR